ncbi:hypothetical protein ScPMuIL_001167 [Solemya velum]
MLRKKDLTTKGESAFKKENQKEMEPTMEADPKILFEELYQKAITMGLNGTHFRKLKSLQDLRTPRKNRYTKYITKGVISVLGLLLTLFVVILTEWPISNYKLISVLFHVRGMDIEREQCVIGMPEKLIDVFRPPINCGFCRGITEVDHVTNISPDEFEKTYAYTGRPVVIVDGAKNWTATKEFSFEFFRNIYGEDSPVLENVESNCQFFPYKTSFKNLGEVFNMTEERAHMKGGSEPWYIGWSNCDFSAANVLRTHYDRPYFLPRIAESSKTDWIFMGSPGYGAHMHIDNVVNPSWQAQITGTKMWTLEPPPECYYECANNIEVTVKSGEIIVLDTNIWFHSTLNVGEDISICIGSEYD